MINLKRLWGKFKRLHIISFTEKISVLLYFVFIARLHFRTSVQKQNFDFSNIVVILLGGITIVLLARLLSLITRRWSFIHRCSNLLFLLSYTGLSFYHLRAQTQLDYSVIIDNIGLAFYGESAGVIFDIFKRKDIIQFFLIAFVLVMIDQRFHKLNSKVVYSKKFRHFVLVFISYVIFFIGTPYSYEEFTAFGKTIQDYYGGSGGITFTVPEENYPYRRSFSYPARKNKPHIFIITVESFNANVVLKKSRSGKELTPFFNSLIKKGEYYKNFYGHSIQTSKGQLGVYCSLLPITKKKVFTDFAHIGIKCLPHILKQNGYTNLFFKAFSDINFDNTGKFAEKMGFEYIHGMTNRFISDAERKKYYWGWGVQDSIFYKKFFGFVDELREKGNHKPIFAALTTVSNHMKFKRVPVDQRYIYPNKNSAKERYANSIRVSDEYLKTFFDELKRRDYLDNSIVFVTADHSYPWGEHGNFSSENGFYNENFKIPLVIVGKNIYQKEVQGSFSQMDIAPTILDILGLSAKAPFLGESMLSSTIRPISLIQPYDGTYLSVIVYPYKYVYRKRTKREFCYDLSIDPDEMKNIISEMKESSTYKVYRNELSKIMLNDYLIKNDRIWPVGI